jgi:glucokinase
MFESHSGQHAPAFPRWLGDIGGTNARFGWQAQPQAPISHVQVLPCAEHPTLVDAALSYLQAQGLAAPACAAFGIATAVHSDQVAMTNHHWAFSVDHVRQALGLQRLLLLNDFTALALALPQLRPEQLRQVGAGRAAAGAAVALIGAGTGLGVSGLLPMGHPGQYLPLSGEGGHVTLSAQSELEFRVISLLRKRYGHVSAERVVCGAGLVELYHALCELCGDQGLEITTPADVMARAQAQPGSTAHEAVELFCGFLGSVAGDLALTLGARGGVYIGGGMVPRLGDRFKDTPFRARFEAKGRFSAYLQAIPTWVIDSPVSPALEGASQALTLYAPSA